MDNVVSTESNVISILNNIQVTADTLNKTYEITVNISEYVYLTNDFYNKTQDQKQTVEKYENYRLYVIYGIYAFFGLITLLAFATAFTDYRYLSGFLFVIGILSLPLALLLIGVNLPAAAFLADGCPELETWAKSQSSPSDQIWIDFYLDCQGTPPLQNWTNYVNQSYYEAQELLQQAENQNNTQMVQFYKNVIADIQLISGNLSQLANCQIVQSSYSDTKTKICDNILVGISILIITCIVIGLLVPFIAHNAIKICLAQPRYDDYDELEEESEPLYNDRMSVTRRYG